MKEKHPMFPPYRPEPLTDFSVEENRAAFAAALERIQPLIGASYPMVIDGEQVASETGAELSSINPARPSQVIGTFAQGGIATADRAIAAATRAFPAWAQVPVAERAQYLITAAAEMRRRKHEFSAIMVLEVGKTWAEADADTAESIDFIEYYARQALRVADSSDQLADNPGETLSLTYIPLGVGVVIPPWNFPNAIPMGMVTAALVMGNTVILKPAEQSPLIAYAACQLLWEQGLPKGVLNFVFGDGGVIGARLVEHPQTRFIAFTGSRPVGVQIYETASKVQNGQRWLKRSILEMGGKDAVLVDASADLQAAAKGVVDSAFGFQGQKCSAGSRAILVDAIYDQIVPLIVERARALTIGAPDTGADIDQGPVIDADAMSKILNYIEIGTQEGKLLLGGAPVITDDGGYFIQPTIFGDVAGDASIAQDEIFGPVLTLIRARDFDHALAIANSTEYGLTGAVFSQDRAHLERARAEFHVGNLYFNRKCTGATVGIHPFGGFNMSGTDSKAGGPDYLLLYSQAKLVAERL